MITVIGPIRKVAWLASVTRIVSACAPSEYRLARNDVTKPGLGLALLT
jgi:hypothetical protein